MSFNPPLPGRIPLCRAAAASTGAPCQTPAQFSRNRNYCLWHGRGAPDEFIQDDDTSTGVPYQREHEASDEALAAHDDPFAAAAPSSSPPIATAAPSLVVHLAIPTSDRGSDTTSANGGGANDRKRKRGNASGRRVRFELSDDEEEDIDNGGGGGGDTEAAQGEAAGHDELAEKESLVVKLRVQVGAGGEVVAE